MMPAPEPMTAPGKVPRIWRVLGDKRGDNGQVEMITQALRARHGWVSDLRRLEMRPKYVKGKPRVGPTLHHLDRARSDELAPPWPDLILTSGRRPGNVALWIKRQSGGKTKIVMVGKPSGWVTQYDLIITSAETLPAPDPNVIYIGLPLMGLDQSRLADARDTWQPALSGMPRPLVAFMLGGPTSPFRFSRSVRDALRARIAQVLQAGGTPYLVSSRRTPPDFMRDLATGLDERVQVFDWARQNDENPYAGLLAHADRAVVTGDSIAMQVEALRAGLPLEIMPLPTGWLGGLDNRRRRASARLFRPARGAGLRERLRIAFARGLSRVRLMPQTRYFPWFHDLLIARGLARWAGDDRTMPASDIAQTARSETEADMTRILDRIDALFAEG